MKNYDFGSLDPLKPYMIVLTESGVIRSFATTVPAKDLNMPDYGELCALYVDPDHLGPRHWRCACVGSACTAFRSGISKSDSLGTRRQRSGGALLSEGSMALDGAQRTDEGWGFKVNEVRYRRSLEGGDQQWSSPPATSMTLPSRALKCHRAP